MQLTAEARTHSAVAFPHTVSIRVEVWRGDEQVGLASGADIIGGGVTDQWVSGPRRSLDMSVPQTADWLAWLTIGVELRPFRGVWFGASDIEWCPLGCFPIRKFTRPRAARTPLPVRAADRAQRIAADPFEAPRKALSGRAAVVAAHLIQEVDPYGSLVEVLATSGANTPDGVWDKTRSDTITDLVTGIGAEWFYGRDGTPVIRDLPGTGTPVLTLRSGRGNTVTDLSAEIDWEKVTNAVGVYSTATNTTLEPIWIGISDPTDPAFRSNISGSDHGGWQSMRYASPLFTTVEQMYAAADALLRKGAAPAEQYQITCIPNPSLDASDTIWIEPSEGAALKLVQVQSVTHPLTAGDLQTVTTVSTRTAGDLVP